MELSDKDIQLIEDALLERLSDKGQLQFHQRMKDVQFSEEYERHIRMVDMLNAQGRTEVKASLQKIDQELPPLQSKKPGIIPMYVRWLVAASVIALIGYIGFQRFATDMNMEVYNKYYETYPNLIDPITKGAESEAMSPFQLFESGRYEAAQTAFSDLEQSDAVEFYFALTFLQTEDYERAILELTKISNNDSHRFYLEAKWYLALAHIAINNIDMARSILKDLIEDENTSFQERARNILNDLK